MLPNFSLDVLGKKIAFSTLVQYAGKALQLVLSAFALKIISNFFSQDGYGVYAAITEYALFFSVVANLGIFGNVVRLMADRPDDGNLFLNAMVLRVITGLFFFALAILICIFTGNNATFVFGTALFCSALFFDFVTSVCDGMLQANYMMGRANIALVCGRLINVGVLILLTRYFTAWHGAAFNSMWQQYFVLGATLLGSFVTCGLSLLFVARKIRLSWQTRWLTILKILKVSLPYGIIIIVNNLYFRFIPDYLAHHFLTDAYFGSFNIYFRISQVLSLASTFLMFSALPGLTEYIDASRYTKAKKLFTFLKRLFLVSGTGLVVIGSLVGPWVVSLLTHEKYNIPQLWFLLPLMLVLAAVSYGYDLVFLTLFAFNEDVWFLKREFLALAIGAVFFGLSFTITDLTLQMIFILSGAIAAESTMVILGMLNIRRLFHVAQNIAQNE
jgi:O-antigen/teichoic acid export membrane protein